MLKPRYHKSRGDVRVCYWQAHGWVIQKGILNKDGKIVGNKTFDPWVTESRPFPDLTTARKAMYQRFPILDSKGNVMPEQTAQAMGED